MLWKSVSRLAESCVTWKVHNFFGLHKNVCAACVVACRWKIAWTWTRKNGPVKWKLAHYPHLEHHFKWKYEYVATYIHHIPPLWYIHHIPPYVVNMVTTQSTTNTTSCGAGHNKPRPLLPTSECNWPVITNWPSTCRPVYLNWPTPHLPWKFHANRSSHFLVMLLTKKQRKKETEIARKQYPIPLPGAG